MANLKQRKLANYKILAGMLLSAALAVAASAQVPRQLQVEVGPNQQIRIVASHVSYGEVLRALRGKLGWEIEIPSLADELKLSYARVEASQPQEALRKLLEGSGLGYAFLGEVNGSSKVFVIPFAPRETKAPQDPASRSRTPDSAVAGVSLQLPAPVQAMTIVQLNGTAEKTMLKRHEAPSTMPLSEAINIIGVPPGLSPADVGKTMTLPMSDAARIIGASPGTSPSDVGQTKTLPLPTGPGKHP